MKLPNETYGANVRVTWIQETEAGEAEMVIDGFVRLGKGNYLDFSEDMPDAGEVEILEIFRLTDKGYKTMEEHELEPEDLDSISELLYNTYIDGLEDNEHLEFERKLNSSDSDEEYDFNEYE